MSFLPPYCHSFRITVIPSGFLSFLPDFCHSFQIFVIPSEDCHSFRITVILSGTNLCRDTTWKIFCDTKVKVLKPKKHYCPPHYASLDKHRRQQPPTVTIWSTIAPRSHSITTLPRRGQKFVNLQYNMLVCWADGTNNSSTKRLMFQVLFSFS